MPDFLDFINKGFTPEASKQDTLTETDEAVVKNNSLNPVQEQRENNTPYPGDDAIREKVQEQEQGQQPPQEQPPEPTALEQGQDAFTEDTVGLNVQAESRHVESDPGTWTPEYTQMGFIEKTGESLLRGFGKHVVGGTGDMIQMANLVVPGWEMAEGNMLSRSLQEVGNRFADKHQIFMPEEMRDPKFNLKTFMDPNFWSGHVAEYIPQLIEFIFLSKGVGGLAKVGTKKLASKVGKNTAKKYGKEALKNTTEQIAKGASSKTVQEIGGTGLGKLITQTGEASKMALTGAEAFGGGVSMNILSGALNAAQQINDIKDDRDADGNLIYDDADLRAIASGTMAYNLQYLPIDMLSWGMTYAKGSNFMNKLGTKTKTSLGFGKKGEKGARQFFTKADQLKYSGKSFLNQANPFLSKIEKTANRIGKPLFEGFEETFQETYEEWAQKKSFSDHTGEPMKYENFMDFYNSEENEATKAIAFALGGLGGGSASLIQSINSKANDNFKLWNRAEMLKRGPQRGNRESEMMFQWHVSDQMISNKLDETNVTNQEWIQTFYDEGKLTEEEFEQQLELADEIDNNYNQAESMNVRGKMAFLQNKGKKLFYDNAITEQETILQEKIANLTENITDDPKLLNQKIKEVTKDYETLKTALKSEQALATENIQNLLSGKIAQPSYTTFIKDENGKTVAIGMNEQQYEDFYNESDESIFAKSRLATLNEGKNFIQKLSSKAKSIFNNLKEKSKEKSDAKAKIKSDEELANSELVNELTEDNIDSFENGKITLGKNEFDLSVLNSLEENERTQAFADINEEIKKYNEEITKAKKESESKKDDSESKSKQDPKNPKEVEVPVRLATVINETYKSDRKNNLSIAVKGIIKRITGLDLDTSNPEQAKKDLLEFAESQPNSSKLGQIFETLSESNPELEMLADYLYELYLENKIQETEEVEENEENETGETAKQKIVKTVKKAAKFARSTKAKLEGPTNGQIALANRKQSEMRTRIYSSDFNSDPVSKNEIDAYLTSAIGTVTYGPTVINKAIALNHHLRAMFPDTKITAYAMTNLYNAVGVDALGYAVLSSILIDEKVWEQDDIYMHEFSHIHYQISKDEPFIQDFMKRAVMTNKSLLKDIMSPELYQHLILFKDNLTGEIFERGAVSEDRFLKELAIDKNRFTALPLQQQDKILEEAYVHTIQGPLSQKFNKHFDAKKEPLRRVFVKRVFSMFKKKAEQNTLSGSDLLEALSKGKNVPVGNIEAHILDSFVEQIQGKTITTSAMASKVYEKNAKTIDEENEIYSKWYESITNQIGAQIDGTFKLEEDLVEEDEVLENEEDYDDDYDDDGDIGNMSADELEITKYDKSFKRLSKKMGLIFQNFFEEYYKKREAAWKEQNKTAGFPSPFQEEKIKRDFMMLAKQTDTPWYFINQLEKTNDPDLKEFMAYLGDYYGDTMYQNLVSSHMLYKNREVVPMIIHQLDSNGNYKTVTALSVAEEKIIENINKKNIEGGLLPIIDDLISEDPSIESIKQFFGLLSNSSINMEAIIKNNSMYVQNKKLTLKGAFLDLRSRGMLTETGLSTDTRELMTAILNTNRQYSSMSIVTGPTGTQTSSAVLNNALTQLMTEVSIDLQSGMKEGAFVKKYSHEISSRKRGLSEINKTNKAQPQITSPLLKAWHKNFIDNGEVPSITQDGGNRNIKTNESKDYKNSNANEQLINEALLYVTSIFNNPSNVGGINTYPGSLDVFGDSSRRYLISMPVHKKSIDSSGNITAEGEQLLKATYQSYTVSRVDESSAQYNEWIQDNPLVSYEDFKKAVLKDIKNNIEYLNEKGSDLSQISTFSGFYNNNKLNSLGKQAFSQFTFVRLVNSYLGHQTLNPGIPLNSIQKRNKGNISPVMVIDKNMRLEYLFVTDEFLPSTDIKRNDGGQYILESQALAMERQGKGVIDLNKGFKLFSHKPERNNPKFIGKTPQMKGYTSIITEEMVKPGGTQENLKPYYDLLISRQNKFENWYIDEYKEKYNPEFNTQGDRPAYIGIITPISAEKGGLLSKQDLNKLKEFSTLDAFKLPKGLEEYNKVLDLFHYNKGKFHGFDGSNFGPQQVMDKEYRFTTFSVQSASSFLVGQKGDLARAEAVQEQLFLHKKQMIEQKLIKNIGSPFLSQQVLKSIDKDLSDHITVAQLKDGANIFSPKVNESITYHIRKQAIRLGNNIKTPGTYAQTISDLGYKGMYNKQNQEREYSLIENEGLRYYGINSRGKTRPMETIIPKSQAKDTRKREKIYGVNAGGIVAGRIKGSPLMKEFGLTKDEVDGFVEDHKIYATRKGAKTHIGYYIPGEYVMMTRIPHNGPAFMAIAEVVDFNESGASNIVVPSKYKDVIGSDDDGDALFVYKAATINDGLDLDLKQKHWNKAFELMKAQWQSPDMYSFLIKSLKFESKTQEAIEIIADDKLDNEKAYKELNLLRRTIRLRDRNKSDKLKNEYKSKRNAIKEKYKLNETVSIPFTTESYKSSFNNSVIAKQTLGIGFNSHRMLNIIAAYGAKITNPKYAIGSKVAELAAIKINGVGANQITDWITKTGRTRVQRSTELANILLDAAKNSQTDPLKLNKDTVGIAFILSNMGFTVETIGKLFNHPAALKYINSFSDTSNSYIETGSRAQILADFRKNLLKFNAFDVSTVDVTVTKQGNKTQYESAENETQIIKLLNLAFKVNGEVSQLSKLMSGHKRLEINPHALEKQIKDSRELINNKGKNQILKFGPGFANNPEIKAYLNTAEEWNDITKGISIVFDPTIVTIMKKVSTSITSDELNPKQLKYFSDKVQRVIYSQAIGLNNNTIEDISRIFDYTRPDSLNAKIVAWREILSKRIITEDPNDPDMNITELKTSIIFNEALDVFTDKIVVAREFFTNKVFDENQWNKVRQEFSEMPDDLQRDLVAYDLVEHGWESKDSFYQIFSKDFHQQIDQYLKKFVSNGNKINNPDEKTPVLPDMENKIVEALLQMEMTKSLKGKPNNLPTVYLNNQKTVDFSHHLIAAQLKLEKNRWKFAQKIRRGEPFYLEVRSYNKDGKENGSQNNPDRRFVKINALDPKIRASIINTAKTNFQAEGSNRKQASFNMERNFANLAPLYLQNVADLIENFEPTPLPNKYVSEEVLLVSQTNSKSNDPVKIKQTESQRQKEVLENYRRERDQLKKKVEPVIKRGKAGMAFKVDMSNFEGTDELSRQRFVDASQFRKGTLQEDIEVAWIQYQSQKEVANSQRKEVYTDEFILNMSDNELLDAYKEFGKKDKFAYSIILTPILLRMVDMASAEQSKITGRTEGKDDITVLKAYLQSNNVNASHPATQAVQRELETEFKSFVNERKKYVKKINQVTEKLYAEKFGLKTTSSKLFNKLKLAALSLFKNRMQIYLKLYGNIVTKKTQDGKVGYQLKTKAELDSALSNGQITKAEHEFSEVFRNTIKELNQFSDKPDQNSGGYVPAVAMSRLEAFSHNGLLGLLSNSRPDDHAINNVKIKFQGEILSFKEIEDIFRVQGKNNFKNIKEYVLLKNKAKKLLKLGQNEDGSIIQANAVSNRTLLGDGMINKFANNGFVDQEHLLSMDLNRALNDYVHTSLFVNGNDKFKGFTKLQAWVDGLLIHNSTKGFVNQNKFVQKVYKEYFLKGQRQQNSSTDNVINAFVKGNLLYVMGWKLLAVGKGAYVIGNMMVGKYNNIKNSGGKAWLKGEKRYWGVQGNGFRNRKAIGVLNNLNFMNVNLYDDVSIEKSSGLDGVFSELIFLPMKQSEEWIQGVQYLGTLTDEQWNRYDNNGNLKEGESAITNAELAKIENEVKNAHGKGYTPTDQRMVQQYSWGKAMMQFARFIPTMFYDRWAKEDINIYGEKHIGSLRTVKDLVEKVISGDIDISQLKSYRANLDPETRKQFDSALRGFAMMSVAIFVGQSFNVNTANELTGDANYLVNMDKLEHKLVPSSIQTLSNISKSLYPF